MQAIRFGAVSTLKFNLPDFDSLPAHLKAKGKEEAEKELKLKVLHEATYELSRYAERATDTIPSVLGLRDDIQAGRLNVEDVVVLSNDKPIYRKEELLAP